MECWWCPSSLLDSGFPPSARASADISDGTKMHNNIEQVESMSLGYTTLSAINLKATANNSNMASDQPGSYSSSLYQDLRFPVDANTNPVSGLNGLNKTLRTAWSSSNGRSRGSQDEGTHVGDADSDGQTLGPRHSVGSHDSEGLEFSRFDDNFLTSLSNDQKYENKPRGKIEALDIKKFEEASQAAATKIHPYSSNTSLEEIRMLIENEFRNIFNRAGTRKRGSTDASLTEPAGSKRKTVACGFCPKKMLRECDLKYQSPFRRLVWSAKGVWQKASEASYSSLWLHFQRLFQGLWQ